MAEWVDALDLGSSAAMRKSSSLFGPTKKTLINQKYKEQKSQTPKFWHHFGTICAEITSKPNGLGNDAGYVFSKFPGVVKKQVMEVMPTDASPKPPPNRRCPASPPETKKTPPNSRPEMWLDSPSRSPPCARTWCPKRKGLVRRPHSYYPSAAYSKPASSKGNEWRESRGPVLGKNHLWAMGISTRSPTS
jgi:hypothetical protein